MELDANTQEKIKKKNEIIQKFVNVLKIYGDSNHWDDFYNEYEDTEDKKKVFNYSNEYGYLPAQEVLYNYLVNKEV